VPIHSCTLPDGSSGFKWGDQGKCYRDRADAEKQAQAAYANGYTGDADTTSIAMDKSIHRIDQDGHLHVELSNISKANVCPYFGRKIPDAEKYGLKPDQIYQLYRHPDALKKAAESFNGKPLMIVHKPQTADEHDHRLVIGSVHNVAFDAPYLTAELVVWDGDAIKLIESGDQRELSCGYYYQYVPQPGVADGVPYDGIMTGIVGNHVALVEQGRAGHDVFVGDAKPTLEPPPVVSTDAFPKPQEQRMAVRHATLSKQALLASGALRAYLKPKLAADTKLDLNSILQSVTAANWEDQKPMIKTALDKALVGKLAKDAEICDIIDILKELDDAVDKEDDEMGADEKDEDDEEEKKKKAKEGAEKLKEAAEDEKDDDDPYLKPKMKAADEKDDEDEDDDDEKKSASDESDDDEDEGETRAKDRKGARDRRAAKDRKGARDKAKGMDQQPMVTKAAMDAAIATAVSLATKRAAQEAESSTIARLRAIAEAEKAVRPYIGEIAVAQDSAAAVYRLALDAAGVDLTGVPEAAFPAMVKLLPKPDDQPKAAAKSSRVALDSAGVDRRNAMFPNGNRLLIN